MSSAERPWVAVGEEGISCSPFLAHMLVYIWLNVVRYFCERAWSRALYRVVDVGCTCHDRQGRQP